MHLNLRYLALALVAMSASLFCCASESEQNAEANNDDIIGGVYASDKSLDAVGALLMNGSPFCTGTLVAPTVVISAKHCSAAVLPDAALAFAIGADAFHPNRTIHINARANGPLDAAGTIKFGSDVAVFYLAKPVTDVPLVKVSLDPLTEKDLGATFLAVGYGMQNQAETQYGTRKSGAMRLRALTGRPMETRFGGKDGLLAAARKASGSAWSEDDAEQVLSFYDLPLMEGYEAYLGGGHGANACHGDSGGPLLRTIDGQLTMYGVASWVFLAPHAPCALGTVYATVGPETKTFFEGALNDPCTLGDRCVDNTAYQCTLLGPYRVETTLGCGGGLVCKVVDDVANCFSPQPTRDAGSD